MLLCYKWQKIQKIIEKIVKNSNPLSVDDAINLHISSFVEIILCNHNFVLFLTLKCLSESIKIDFKCIGKFWHSLISRGLPAGATERKLDVLLEPNAISVSGGN